MRKKLGRFENCKSVCKYASRLGLCFSGTYKTVEIESGQIKLMEDVIRNNYTFSDGIGMISPDIFEKVLRNIEVREFQKISALQVRVCGCKGVLAVTPQIKNSIYVRNSMLKFDSDHFKLELCSYAVSRPGYLNRQLILILSGRGVKDSTFLNLQNSMINELQITLSSEAAAEANLKKIDPTYYKDLIFMLANGMKISEDAYLRSMISAIFLASIKLIKSKARILASNSSLLMGVMDEYAVLEYGSVFIQITVADSSEIITGPVAVGKNPCYHPGDIRVLNAVYHEKLSHLHNVVVFPQKGPRPHPNECSGSDLDGDLYFVTWNPNLIPSFPAEPMDYLSSPEKIDEKPDDIHKVIDFFGTFMESENIGRISNAHLIWADKKGICSKEALYLAKLTSVAVEYPKTGIPAIMPAELRCREWPDFMEKTNKPAYQSSGIIGVLYRNCVLDSFDFELDHKLDKKFLVPGYDQFIDVAQSLYRIYSGKMRRLMNQYCFDNEFFLLTVQSDNKNKKIKYDDGLQVQSLVGFYKEQIHKRFREKTSDLLMRRKIASACYYIVYSKPKNKKKSLFLSFPWIFYDYLVQCG